MSHPLLIQHVEYLGEPTDLLIATGVIIPRPEVRPAGAQLIDARGLVASPGPLVDLHVHFRDPGLTEKEDLLTGARAAAAGGYSVVACEPNTRPVLDSVAAIEEFRARVIALGLPVRVYPKAAVTQGQQGIELTDMAGLAAARVAAFSDDGEPLVDPDLLIRAFRASAAAGSLPLTAHCEETPGSSARVTSALGAGAPLAREVEIIRLHIDALAQAGAGRLHIQHVSLAESVTLIADAKRRGLAVTAEVTPHHLLLCADDIPTDGGPDANWKMNPPLRGREDMHALRRGLADGTLDIIATDHAPHTTAEKARGWDAAPFGVVGLETAVGACLSLVHDGTLSMARLFAAMGTTPWEMLPSWAHSRGDSLTLIDPDAVWTVDPDRFNSKGRNCPFAGRTLRGKPVYTLVKGRIVMAEGEVEF